MANNTHLKFLELKLVCEKINLITSGLTNNKIIFFSEISILIRSSNAELHFNTLVSYLYVMYHEDSAKNIEFIRDKMKTFNTNIPIEALENKKLVHAFRTIFQHQMNFDESKDDVEKKNFCEAWFSKCIGKVEPETDNDWQICVEIILNSCLTFFEAIHKTLLTIENHEHLDIIITDWEKKVSLAYTAYDFEKVLVNVLLNLDLLDFFDVKTLLAKNLENWRKSIKMLPYGFNFEKSAYKIIESTIVSQKIIPIDGNDIISLGLNDRRNIPKLLIRAQEIFYKSPCSKELLLIEIKKII